VPRAGFENAPGAKFCGNCGSPIGGVRAAATKQSGISPIRLAETVNTDATDGERKLVTALFADIKGSTELMEDLD
jgi:class 3 adenylate cyclase